MDTARIVNFGQERPVHPIIDPATGRLNLEAGKKITSYLVLELSPGTQVRAVVSNEDFEQRVLPHLNA